MLENLEEIGTVPTVTVLTIILLIAKREVFLVYRKIKAPFRKLGSLTDPGLID